MRAWWGDVMLAGAAALASAPAGAACKVSRIIDMPVTMNGPQPMVEASINGHPLRLEADSGAFYSILGPGTASELGLRLEMTPLAFSVVGLGGSVRPSIATVKELRIGGFPIKNVQFLVGGAEPGGAGLMGQNLLGFRDTEYDLANGMIRLMQSDGCDGANLAYWAADKAVAIVRLQPMDALYPHMTGTISVNDVPLRAMFDTGASTSALTRSAAARLGVHPGDADVEEIGASFGIGRSPVRQWSARFRSLTIDSEQIRNPHLRFVDHDDTNFDMLIGADFFLSHRIYVSKTQHRMFLTYNGGPVFARPRSDTPPPAAARIAVAATPVAAGDAATKPGEALDAAGYSRRGAASAARGDLAHALTDFDAAVALAPDDAAYLQQRGRLHMRLRQPLLAAADLDRAVALTPQDAELLLTRAQLRLGADDRAGARADADAASRLASRQAVIRLDLGGLFSELDAPDEAIAQYGQWMTVHPDDPRMAAALNGRCWARALAGRDLTVALSDCNAALRRAPNTPSFLDSRGLVELRLGQIDRAIADYDRALAGDADLAWSLYGRGIARLMKGATAAGKADLAAATAEEPALPARAGRYGVVPPG